MCPVFRPGHGWRVEKSPQPRRSWSCFVEEGRFFWLGPQRKVTRPLQQTEALALAAAVAGRSSSWRARQVQGAGSRLRGDDVLAKPHALRAGRCKALDPRLRGDDVCKAARRERGP